MSETSGTGDFVFLSSKWKSYRTYPFVVINRSMSGKSIHLSRMSVVSVFACVWIFLIFTHVLFSSLQINAIQNLDELFSTLAKGRQYLQCGVNVLSGYTEIASQCDRTAVFHAFGAYLLRGHTLFTVLFLLASITIFVITISYHLKVRRQHDFIHSGLRSVTKCSLKFKKSIIYKWLFHNNPRMCCREQSPHRRRERLFHTLILSIATFFVSVLGQTYIEIAVFWVDEREEVANLTKWYHFARIAAFVDPVLNPLIVVARTPALRRQLRAQWTSIRSRASSRTRSQGSRKLTRRTSSIGDRRRCDVEIQLMKPDRPVKSNILYMDAKSPAEPFSFYNRTRVIVLALSIACLTFIFSNSIALNFTIICMDDVVANDSGNFTNEMLMENLGSHWLKSSTHINALFSAIAVGCLLGTLPVTVLIHHYGVGRTLSFYGLLSTIGTLGFPLAVQMGYPMVFLMRVLQGIGTALSYPATGLIASQWSTTKGTGTFISLLSCHVQFCSMFTMPLSGALCESSLGWPAIYYLQGTISAVAFATFFLFYKDDPSLHRNVSTVELSKISQGKAGQSNKSAIPYKFVLGYDVTSTGFATALPYILAAATKFVVGPISDRAICISDKSRLVFFAALSQGVMGIGFMVLALVKTPELAQIAYTICIVFSGVNTVGNVKCAQMLNVLPTQVARQHVHVVMAVTSLFICIIVLLLPIVVAFVCPDNTPEQWAHLFIGISVIVIVTNIPFAFLARSEPALWTGNKIYADNIEEQKRKIEALQSDKFTVY
uniref:MFS domain-containing protein n=1 Tax=Heterorhabditis bacteriophora TaxID=37862 RepID=A0A1I7W8V3_HETBA